MNPVSHSHGKWATSAFLIFRKLSLILFELKAFNHFNLFHFYIKLATFLCTLYLPNFNPKYHGERYSRQTKGIWFDSYMHAINGRIYQSINWSVSQRPRPRVPFPGREAGKRAAQVGQRPGVQPAQAERGRARRCIWFVWCTGHPSSIRRRIKNKRKRRVRHFLFLRPSRSLRPSDLPHWGPLELVS